MAGTEAHFKLDFSCASDEELVVIGDIHGRADLLQTLLDIIEKVPTVSGRRRQLVLLGDLIDRGPDSLKCLDLAIASGGLGLLGNHEQMLNVALIDEDDPVSIHAANVWIRNGGGAVISEMMDANPGKSLDVPGALGPQRMAWLDSLVSHYISGQVLAVHAGINPDTPVEEFLTRSWQNLKSFREQDHWAWVREPFLDHQPGAFGHQGYFVVHGHTTPSDDATTLIEQLDRARVNLDGGSYKTGRARMVRIVGNQATLFEVH